MYKYMKLFYYFNGQCGCCKDYDKEVTKIQDHFKIDGFWRDTDKGEVTHTINGVPTVIIEKDGKTIYKNVGNLPSERIIEELEELFND